jgi:hypothetical protein
MEPDDLLCSRNTRSRTPLARANGTSRRASGWEGEKVARSGGLIRAILEQYTRASLEGGIEGRLDGLLCSCNARSQKTLVGHVQWETL